MNILDQIIAHKKKEVAARQQRVAVEELERSPYFTAPLISLKKALLNDAYAGIIAEFKRKSPSKGIINKNADVVQATSGYIRSGASALSVLTDTEFFGGTNQDFLNTRKANKVPILRKDFIVDEYQVIEAKSLGADVILLLANVLSASEIKQFATTAKWLGMEVLLEVRSRHELKSVNVLIDCIGVNNRNLKDFQVNVDRSFELAELIPKDFIKISESGIDSAKTIHALKKAGFKGFLIGESFMKTEHPEDACEKLIKEIREFK